ncbi:MAG: Hint domain-containing protein [Roseinatronobacter sp.]
MPTITLAPALAPRAKPAVSNSLPKGIGLGAQVKTIFGLRAVETLMAGDLLLDAHDQIVELRGVRRAQVAARDLVQIDPSAMGLGMGTLSPARPLILGAGQMVAQRDWRSEVLFGGASLCPARALVDRLHVRAGGTSARVLCVLEFDTPVILHADGVLVRI